MSNSDWYAMQKARDDDLRPWVRDPAMDVEIDAQYIALQEGFKRTAPMDKSGAVSQLDRKPQQLVALHETFRAKQLDHKAAAAAVAEEKELTPTPDTTTTNTTNTVPDDVKSLAETTHAMMAALESRRSSRASKRGKRAATAAAATVAPKNSMEAVKYDPVGPRRGPATYNMSAAEYQRFVAKMAAVTTTAPPPVAEEDDGAAADETKYDLDSLDGGSLTEDINDDIDGDSLDGGSSTTATTKFPPIHESPHRPSTTDPEAAAAAVAPLFKDTPQKPSTSSSKPKPSANSWLKVEGTHVASPAPAPAPTSTGPLVVESVAKPLVAAHTVTVVTHPTTPPRMQISRDGAMSLFAATAPDSESKLLHELTSPPSAKSSRGGLALLGQSLAPAADSTHQYGPHGNALGHKRIKELKALKELMMTTTGSVGINVHPETSADINEENKRMREVTIKCIQDCMGRNQTDSTGALLVTPGFLEAIGPSNFYKSDAGAGFVLNDRFQEALKNVDVSRGLKMDKQGKWVENAAKNKQKMFVSGGAMKL
jgi:hypothetical protein